MTREIAPVKMTLLTLWWRNLRFHARAHLVIFLGSMITCATLTGALLVGASLQESLLRLNQQRLGLIQQAIVSSQFFESALAERLAQQEIIRSHGVCVVPVLQLAGTVIVRHADGRLASYIRQVQVLGVPDEFWRLFGTQIPDLTAAIAVNDVLANRLNITPGALLELRLQRPGTIPAETLVGRATDESGSAWQSTVNIQSRPVNYIVSPREGGRFTLYPQAHAPLTVYLPLTDLQRRLREPLNLQSPANVLLIGNSNMGRPVSLSDVARALRQALRLEDYGLRLRLAAGPARYVAVESNRLLLEDRVAQAAIEAAEKLGYTARATLTYLVNLTWCPEEWFPGLCFAIGSQCIGDNVIQRVLAWHWCYHYVPYMTVTVLDPSEDEPWGPFFCLDGSRWTRKLRPGEILLTEPVAYDLLPFSWGVVRGDVPGDERVIRVRYFLESGGWLLKEREASLKLAGILAWKGATVDPVLTPEFPGLRGSSPRDWKPPFPRTQWHPEWIRSADDRHWQKHRAAPRAFVSAETAEKLGWFSRHGKWTSVRIASTDPRISLDELMKNVERTLLEALSPEQYGFTLLASRSEAEAASQQGPASMFGMIFLSFSAFLSVSALILIVLLVRLHLLERSKEFGLLAALGFRPSVIRLMLILELAPAIILGCLAAMPLSVGYAAMLLQWIRWRWPGETLPEVFQSYFATDWHAWSILINRAMLPGVVISGLAGIVAALLAIREIRQWSPRALLTGQVSEEVARSHSAFRPWLDCTVGGGFLITALACMLAGFLRETYEAPIWFFAGGGALLLFGLLLLKSGLRRLGPDLVNRPNWVWLGLRFVSRQPRRNMLTAALLAVAVFLISAVQAFYKMPPTDPYMVSSGTGGFALLAENDIPLPFVPETESDWQALLPDWSPEQIKQLLRTLETWGVRIYGCRVQPGEDVSCLNLYRPHRPRILGLPDSLIRRDGFWLSDILISNPDERKNPWLALYKEEICTPAFADAQTAEWVLHVRVGDVLTYPVGAGEPVNLRLVGLLRDSIFQGALLVSERQFTRLFPGRYGYSFFLIETRQDVPVQLVRECLESALGERYGFGVRPTLDVLAEFAGIENLYLLSFQLLGGIGLMLGGCGLGVVLLRNVWERSGELALLQALGYPRRVLAILLLIENGIVTLMGVGIGLMAALLGLVPHLSSGVDVLAFVMRLAILMVTVLATGIVSGILAVRKALRLPVLAILRRE